MTGSPTAQGPRQSSKKGPLWAVNGAESDSKISLPVAAGIATAITLLLVGGMGDFQWQAPANPAPLITRVELIKQEPTPAQPAPPAVAKTAPQIAVGSMAKQAKAPKIISPEVVAKLPPPDVAPAEVPAAVQPLATVPVTASAKGASTAPVTSAPPSAMPLAVHQAGISAPSMAVVCPVQIRPEMPRKAIQEGLSGRVRARALIQDGIVKEVVILSGPQVFHAAVKAAMFKYQCESRSAPVSAEQVVDFEVE